MGDTAIRAGNLWKQYQITTKGHRHDTLRDQLMDSLKNLFHLVPRSSKVTSRSNTFWAIKDVSFEVRKGEVVGIIGCNGAGKSTLLKVLSGITLPTKGRAEIYGRVGSLLEVGTGFHHELTGRENIYLSGAINGMKKVEIDRKFDEIVAFAEIEQFIDTPVKRYSTGMYMRLAFAVAAHLEPEILLIDEALAVGDGRFQKKCLNKMEDIGQQGRTVLFVSHTMPAIVRLCERAILLDEGRVVQDGPSHEVVSAYLTSGRGTSALREWPDVAKSPGGEVARLRAVRVKSASGAIIDSVDVRQPVIIEMDYEVLKPDYMLMPNFQFYNEDGVHVFSAHDVDPAWRRRRRPVGRYRNCAEVPGDLLSEGIVYVGAGLTTLDPLIFQFYVLDAVAFQVIDSLVGDSARGEYPGKMGGVVRPLLNWSTQFTPHSI